MATVNIIKVARQILAVDSRQSVVQANLFIIYTVIEIKHGLESGNVEDQFSIHGLSLILNKFCISTEVLFYS